MSVQHVSNFNGKIGSNCCNPPKSVSFGTYLKSDPSLTSYIDTLNSIPRLKLKNALMRLQYRLSTNPEKDTLVLRKMPEGTAKSMEDIQLEVNDKKIGFFSNGFGQSEDSLIDNLMNTYRYLKSAS